MTARKWHISFFLFLTLFWLFPACDKKSDNLVEVVENKKKSSPKGKISVPEKRSLQWFQKSWSVFHGIPAKVKFALPAGKGVDAEGVALFKEATEIFNKIDTHFNAFDEASELSKINARESDEKPIEVSEYFLEIMMLSKEIYEKTNGAFDPSVQPLKTLWRAAEKKNVAPSEKAIDKAMQSVGFSKVELDKQRKTISFSGDGVSLDFGGIAKGLAVDEIVKILKAAGVKDALVQCGGEIRAFGISPRRGKWRIGVQHPEDKSKIYGAVGGFDEFAVSTSGNYYQPIRIGDMDYYHIFDPRDGQPVTTKILGVTVVLPSSKFANAEADGFATAMTVLGVEKGIEFARKIGADVLFLYKDENEEDGIGMRMTRNFGSHYTPPKR